MHGNIITPSAEAVVTPANPAQINLFATVWNTITGGNGGGTTCAGGVVTATDTFWVFRGLTSVIFCTTVRDPVAALTRRAVSTASSANIINLRAEGNTIAPRW